MLGKSAADLITRIVNSRLIGGVSKLMVDVSIWRCQKQHISRDYNFGFILYTKVWYVSCEWYVNLKSAGPTTIRAFLLGIRPLWILHDWSERTNTLHSVVVVVVVGREDQKWLQYCEISGNNWLHIVAPGASSLQSMLEKRLHATMKVENVIELFQAFIDLSALETFIHFVAK